MYAYLKGVFSMSLLHTYFLAITPSLVLALITYYAYCKSSRYIFIGKNYEKRLRHFAARAFYLFEPHLYRKDISYQTFLRLYEELSVLAEKNRLLVNDRILDHLDTVRKFKDSPHFDYMEHFESFCDHIDSDISFLQAKLGLPRRGFLYRFNHNQRAFRHLLDGNVLSEFIQFFLLPFLFYLTLFFKAMTL